YGDYYPLTPWSLAPEGWIAWQFDRPDLKSGIALAFRRQNNPDSSFTVNLHGLPETRRYRVQFTDDSYHLLEKTMTGMELSHLHFTIDHPRGSVLIHYAAG
ncbi:MAG: GH36 C-terminal domain-containing protein, partial [Armatimonadota bacterium]|nr:GH36 C-terminal domain-containing protein [Armatimonadota bacterium]